MWRLRTSRSAVGVLVLVLAANAASALACGPFFPNRLLMWGDEAVLWAPVADFRAEIQRLQPANATGFRALVPDEGMTIATRAQQTAEADVEELRAVLTSEYVDVTECERLLSAHAALRGLLRKHASRAGEDEQGNLPTPIDPLPDAQVPAGLPAEFELYLRGAVAYYRGDRTTAISAWEAVLALPPAQRHYRSTWAAYMLGRALLPSDSDGAARYFQQVRSLAAAGFADSTGLAAASFGWEARSRLDLGDYEGAIGRYFEQMATGDPTALLSLRLTAIRVLDAGDEVLRRVVRDESTRPVVTAYLLAQGGPRQAVRGDDLASAAERWLSALRAADVRDVAGADRLAWCAYQAGEYANAEHWLKLAPAESPLGHWLRAKLALRAGQRDAGLAELAKAARLFPPDEDWEGLATEFGDGYFGCELWPARRVWGEIGVLQLARRQYVEAADALLRGGYWMDAAYVAECVLTADELVGYVRKNWPAAPVEAEAALFYADCWPVREPGETDAAYDERYKAWQGQEERRVALRRQWETNVRIRHLLARRLARAKQWAGAREFMPETYEPALMLLLEDMQRGHDRSQPAAERAIALWRAAQTCRQQGIELLGTELEPDWYAAAAGNYELTPAGKVRFRASELPLTGGTADERRRVQEHALVPARRWHYRYQAADLAWEAAALLPDESDDTARVLCAAGGWLKARDPQAADRFYKALVRRCGSTELGREAASLHWFPKMGGD